MRSSRANPRRADGRTTTHPVKLGSFCHRGSLDPSLRALGLFRPPGPSGWPWEYEPSIFDAISYSKRPSGRWVRFVSPPGTITTGRGWVCSAPAGNSLQPGGDWVCSARGEGGGSTTWLGVGPFSPDRGGSRWHQGNVAPVESGKNRQPLFDERRSSILDLCRSRGVSGVRSSLRPTSATRNSSPLSFRFPGWPRHEAGRR